MIRTRLSAVLVLAALAALAACGGSDTPPVDKGPLDMVVVAGQNQRDTVLVQLPEVIDVIAGHRPGQPSAIVLTGPSFSTGSDTVVSNLTPIRGAVVSFVVPDPECGRPFAGSALTDTSGHAKERWVLGKKAKACVMEARLVDQVTGAAIVVDSIHATVLPGAPVLLMTKATYRPGGTEANPYTGFAYGDTVPVLDVIESVTDLHGNVIPVTLGDVSWTLATGTQQASTMQWQPAPAVLTQPGTWRLMLRVGGTTNFIWIRVPAAP